MDSAKVGGLVLVAVVALLILKQAKPEWAPLVRVAAAIAAFGCLLSMVSTVLGYVAELNGAGSGGLAEEGYGILLRSLGVAFLTELCASVCRDSGEGGLAAWVEMAGKLEILLLSFPLIRTVLDTIRLLLGGL